MIFCNQSSNFDVFSQNPIMEVKEMHGYPNFLSRILSRINSGAADAVPTSRQSFNEDGQSLTVFRLLPLMW